MKRSQLLTKIIRQEISKHHDFLSFATFMELALYHPTLGYYQTEPFDIGAKGDFTTAAEISPLYAKCFAKQFLLLFDHLPAHNLLEIGAGTGRFACDLSFQLSDVFNHYYIYEKSLFLREKQRSLIKETHPDLLPRFTWLEELPSSFNGIVIANEVLDALPVHCFHVDHHDIKEKGVIWQNEQFSWQLHEPTTQALAINANRLRELYALPVGYESELNLSLPSFMQSLLQMLDQGILFFADYGYGQQEYYHPERQRGTLTCFYQHQHHDNPLVLPGLQDITAHVDFTHVIEQAVLHQGELAGFTTQAAFLLGCGLMEIAAKDESGLSIAEQVRLHQNIKTLTLPTEMGERVKMMCITKGMDKNLPLIGFKLQDRRRDL